ncbi:hypothetical protein KIN20_035280 [Parelaphostrongylus tenuis]|uniref:Uncharacterized protein n=1 Tax=Parelaphostrongylus tenuis TaxID=148309 RepID=A0AAD5WJK1_PARTN|nr:hypothetical protein KIN20_035280 [Parelaphostrongylus tenuis]
MLKKGGSARAATRRELQPLVHDPLLTSSRDIALKLSVDQNTLWNQSFSTRSLAKARTEPKLGGNINSRVPSFFASRLLNSNGITTMARSCKMRIPPDKKESANVYH